MCGIRAIFQKKKKKTTQQMTNENNITFKMLNSVIESSQLEIVT